MKVCVIGAGAIGGLLAARLAFAGADVSVVARGANLSAIAAHGLRLIDQKHEMIVRLAASDQLSDFPDPDLIVLALKAHQLAAVVDDVARALHPNAIVLTAQNGIPWWYFMRHGGPFEGVRIESVDPGGVISMRLPVKYILASVVYPAAVIERPGVVRHIEGDRFTLGELDGERTERSQRVSDLLIGAGFKAPVVNNVRAEIWMKLWGNLSFNPISALTHATLEEICQFAPTRALAAGMMREAAAIGEALGVRFRISLDKRIAGAEAVGAHKTSMLQDIENGRLLEIDALLGSIIELGCLVDIPTPTMSTVFALVKLLDRTRASVGGRLVITN